MGSNWFALFLILANVFPASSEAVVVSGTPLVRLPSGAEVRMTPGGLVDPGVIVLSEQSVTVLRIGQATFVRLAPDSQLQLLSESEARLVTGRLLARSDREFRVHGGPLDTFLVGAAHFSQEAGAWSVQAIDGRLSVQGPALETRFGVHAGEPPLALPGPFWARVGKPTLLGIVTEETAEQLVLFDGQQKLTLQRDSWLPGRGAVVKADVLPGERPVVQALKVLGRLPGRDIPPLLLLRVLGGSDLLLNALPDGIIRAS